MVETEKRLNAEYAVAGAILIDGGAWPLIAGKVSPEDFSIKACGLIVQAAGELAAAGTPVDPLTITRWAQERGAELDPGFLVSLMEVTPSASGAGEYARMVRSNALGRRVKSLARQVLEDESAPPETLLTSLQSGADSLIRGNTAAECITADEMMGSFYKDLTDRCSGVRNVVPSGYRKLDALLGGGFLKGGLYIIAARPGIGKTTFALNLVDGIPGGLLFVTLEMSANQLTARRLARRTGISASRLLMGDQLTEQEEDYLAKASAALAMSGMVVNRSPSCTVAQIGLMAASVKDLQAVVVDYLGLIRPENPKLSRYEAITQISGELKQLAIRLNVPILCLCQLNRASENRDDRRPRLSDLRDSGAIEQDADGVLLLSRPEQAGEYTILDAELAKNRHGSVGRVPFTAAMHLAMLREQKP